jgi:hypothetical protein
MGTLQQRNAALKKFRILHERRRAKLIGAGKSPPAPPKPSPRRIPISAGDIFDKLTALELRPSQNGNAMWLFKCVCGEKPIMRVSRVTAGLRKFGWAACPACYRKAGGWKGLKDGVIGPKKPTRKPGPKPLPEKVVNYIASRPSFVRVTTIVELMRALKEPREAIMRAVKQGVQDERIAFKRANNADGYVPGRASTKESLTASST